MSDRSDVIYQYDGSFEGLMCCVFEGVFAKETPMDILIGDRAQQSFYSVKVIVTNEEKASRVTGSIPRKICQEAKDLVELGFLSDAENKEMLIFSFLKLGYQKGRIVMDMLQNDVVSELTKAVRNLMRESHNLKGFIRFSIHGNALFAKIGPKNQVLPLLSEHFSNRYRNETFMILDTTHDEALIHRPHESRIVPVEDFRLEVYDDDEADYQDLWRAFYTSIAIKERYNPKCRMSHMPKRYWKYMTEFQLYAKNQKNSGALPKHLKPLSGETYGRTSF